MGAPRIIEPRLADAEARSRPRLPRSATWTLTIASSVAAHALGFVFLAALLRMDPGRPRRTTLGLATFVVDDAAMLVDVADDMGGNDRPAPRLREDAPTARRPRSPTAVGDEADRAIRSQRPAAAVTLPRSAPTRARAAPDTGEGTGRKLIDSPWRRDTSWLHERVADGARGYQPSREATTNWSPPASPQAVRREPVLGSGDSSRTHVPQPPAPIASYPAPPELDDQPGGPTRDGQNQEDPPRREADEQPPPRPTPPPVVRHEVVVGRGPLDSERGPRSFDVSTAMRDRVSDDTATRAASAEAHPGIADFSLAAAPGASHQGQGPAAVPGAVAAVSTGSAASLPGRRGVPGGLGDEESQRERTYDRYNQEIRRRVGRALVFPKDLALRLEQGETLLRFVLQPDGRLSEAARVVKSSGFEGFDQAALDAVQHALPFPAMPDPLHARPKAFNVRIPFPNPVIR